MGDGLVGGASLALRGSDQGLPSPQGLEPRDWESYAALKGRSSTVVRRFVGDSRSASRLVPEMVGAAEVRMVGADRMVADFRELASRRGLGAEQDRAER